MREEIDVRLGDVAAKHQVQVERKNSFPGLLPFEEPRSQLVELASKLTGFQAEAVAFGTEAPTYKNWVWRQLFRPGISPALINRMNIWTFEYRAHN